MAEHLNPGGRAGIIVPEGIIFQSQNAYKALRKMLVENYLWAVVSLPAGVFNPYSGVKTSILFLDRNLARRTDEVLFVKVENDGFDLGAQRRPNGKNDLPEALEILDSHKKAQKAQEGKMALTVSRKRLLESPDVNLSGDRYRTAVAVQSKWPMVKLGDVCELTGGGTPSKEEKSFWTDGTIKWLSAKHINDQHSVVGWELITEQAVRDSATNIIPANAVVVVTRVSVGKLTLLPEPMAINQDLTGLVVRDATFLNTTFLFWVIKGCITRIVDAAQGLGVKGVTRQFVADIEIPRPPLEEQERIVAELDGYRRVIEGARQVIANYKPTIKIDPEWPRVKLAEVFKLSSGEFLPEKARKDGPYKVYGGNGVTGSHNSFTVESPTLVIGRVGAYCGAVHITEAKAWITDNALYAVEFIQECDQDFIAVMLRELNLNQHAKVGGQPSISQTTIYELSVPLPPLDIQRRIVAELEAERALVEANRELIARMEAKIKAKLAEVWGNVTEVSL